MLMGNKIELLLCAGLMSGVFGVSAASGQSDHQSPNAVKNQPAQLASTSVPDLPARSPSPLTASRRNKHADNYYKSVWGIDRLEVRETASGVLLRFSYRVEDANKAQMLNDKKVTPYLIDEKTGAVLQVPTMPKVGMLRQTASPTNGLDYWMVFSNKGVFVKPGSRVDVVIGNFRAKGLIVQQ